MQPIFRFSFTHTHIRCSFMTYLKAVEAGVDVIDTAMSPFALGTSQPATEVMVETFKGTPCDSGLDRSCWQRLQITRPIRDEALESGLLNPKNMGVNIKTLLYQVPGGMLSNLTSQLKEQNEDKYYEGLEEVPRFVGISVNRRLLLLLLRLSVHRLYLTLLMGERYKMATKEIKDVLMENTVQP